MKKLKDADESLSRFLGAADVLKDRLGPILFQLPPRWKANPERLRDFAIILPPDRRYAFEFRDSSWFQERVLQELSDAGCALCLSHIEGVTAPKEITADFVYIRLHGPGKAYQGRYTREDLAWWAGAISSWVGKGLDVFCYFDNDENAYAPVNARDLQDMLKHPVSDL